MTGSDKISTILNLLWGTAILNFENKLRESILFENVLLKKKQYQSEKNKLFLVQDITVIYENENQIQVSKGKHNTCLQYCFYSYWIFRINVFEHNK